jgi:hypothetical protein
MPLANGVLIINCGGWYRSDRLWSLKPCAFAGGQNAVRAIRTGTAAGQGREAARDLA